MHCAQCGHHDTIVTDTRKHDKGAPLRKRKCLACNAVFRTLEVMFDGDVPTPPKKAKPKAEPVITPKSVKQIKVEARRKNEDRRDRVPSYFIEDDFDDGGW
jgi:transcriptional regulator NrdR family protein